MITRFVRDPLSVLAAILATACTPEPLADAETVVLVHGLGRTPASMLVLETRLEGAGYRVVNFGYPSRSEPLEVLTDSLENAVRKCCSEAGGKLHFVTHSMGGVLVRGYLAQREDPFEGRVVMLSPPNQGSEIVDAYADSPLLRALLGPSGVRLGTDSTGIARELGPVDFSLGIITGDRSINPIGSWLIPGPDDGKVAVSRARVEGAADFIVVPATHTFIMNRRDVAEEVVHFLEFGAFRSKDEGAASEAGLMRPELAFAIAGEAGLTAARDLAVDDSGNVFVFDYDDYVIRKFSSSGDVLATFGGPAGEPGGFQHLMAIRVVGDSLLALDAGAISVFDLSGRLLSSQVFSDTVVSDFPRIHPSGEWAGEWIVEETAEKTLTYRDPAGRERSRVAGYRLDEFFPGVEPGEMFFISPTQARSFVYDFLPDGRLVWAVTDELHVFVGDDRDDPLYSASWSPLAFPADMVQAMRERQAELGPPLFMNIPEDYQLIQHLLVDEEGDIWLYVMSVDRTGFLHLSDQGRELGFHAVEADFDLLSARVTAAEGRLYFLVTGRDETRILVADRP